MELGLDDIERTVRFKAGGFHGTPPSDAICPTVHWSHGPSKENGDCSIERVQIGVRMERSMVKVLKALAEFEGLTLGQLLE